MRLERRLSTAESIQKGPSESASAATYPEKIRQGPVKEVGGHACLRLFFPPPRPSFGSWQRAQTPGGLATDASWPDGRASRPPPPTVPPDRSHAGCSDGPAVPDRTGPH